MRTTLEIVDTIERVMVGRDPHLVSIAVAGAMRDEVLCHFWTRINLAVDACQAKLTTALQALKDFERNYRATLQGRFRANQFPDDDSDVRYQQALEEQWRDLQDQVRLIRTEWMTIHSAFGEDEVARARAWRGEQTSSDSP
jgi:hypothetical protein